MRFVIVTGMSGAGKSTAMKMMEDMGFFCIDNLPIPLLDKLVDFATNFDTQMKNVSTVCTVPPPATGAPCWWR